MLPCLHSKRAVVILVIFVIFSSFVLFHKLINSQLQLASFKLATYGNRRPVFFTRATAKHHTVQQESDKSTTSKSVLEPYVNKVNKELKHLNKFVHLDFKGGPPKVDYFYKLFPYIKSLNVSGVILEYEDMFPFEGIMSTVRHRFAFTKSDVAEILNIARNFRLTVIPLLQTYGHMEYVLKLPRFAHLRESSQYPEIISPCINESYTVLYDMITQIMDLHADSKYLHIGFDEVYSILRHPACTERNFTSEQHLFYYHLANIVTFVLKRWPERKILIWHDMLVKFEMPDELTWLYHNVIPIVWCYAENVHNYVNTDVWAIVKMFDDVWISPAYKGADGPYTYHSSITHYFENQLSWKSLVNELIQYNVSISTVSFAGFSRYDHIQMMCELLGFSIPSLVYSIFAWEYKTIDDKLNFSISTKILGCEDQIPWSKIHYYGKCNFPGHEVYEAFQKVFDFFSQNEPVVQSMNTFAHFYYFQFNVVHKRSASDLVFSLTNVYREAEMLVADFQASLALMYEPHVAVEWLYTYFMPYASKIAQSVKFLDKALSSQNTWPVRPFTNTTHFVLPKLYLSPMRI